MNKFEDSRKYFPHLKTGLTYFNHAAIGPISTRVKAKLDEYIMQRSETVVENYFETVPSVKNAKEKLSRLLNVETKNVAWTDNVSNAMNVIAQGINWKNGDEIILNDIEFPANVYPFLNLEKHGVEILYAKNENGKVDLPQIEKLVTNKTKLISISLVQFLTGYRADIKSIGEFCKKNNIIFCVDAIQAAGVIEINTTECDIDFIAGGSQKWLMGLQGLSYFFISDNLLNQLDQKFVGWTSVNNPWKFLEYNLNLLETADRFQNGTNSRIGLVALDESLNFFEELGYKVIENQIIDNSEYLINLLSENGFDPILKNAERKNLSGIVSLKHEKAYEIAEELKNKKIICSVREGILRISPHFYNNKEDINLLIDELKRL